MVGKESKEKKTHLESKENRTKGESEGDDGGGGEQEVGLGFHTIDIPTKNFVGIDQMTDLGSGRPPRLL
jgi:hypothetical protein